MFRQNKLIIIAAICVGFLLGNAWNLPYKYSLKRYFVSEYGKHVFSCDNAMRQHLISKSLISESPNDQNLTSLQSAELGLIECHYYDKFRKKLISLGLDDNDLAEMGLKAIESSKTDLNILVRQHEIIY